MTKHRWMDARETGEEQARREARITIPKPAPGDRNNPNSDRIIAEIGRIARELSNPSGLSFEEKIRRCAGDPCNEDADEMQKALAGAEAVLAELTSPTAARARTPAKRPAPARAVSAGRLKPVRQHVDARPAAKPPARAVEAARCWDNPNSSRLVGPSDWLHPDDGRHLAAGLAFYDFRDRLAADIRSGRVHGDPAAIVSHATDHCGLGAGDAAEWTERFFASIGRDLERRRTA
jgi:hypothetical protein